MIAMARPSKTGRSRHQTPHVYRFSFIECLTLILAANLLSSDPVKIIVVILTAATDVEGLPFPRPCPGGHTTISKSGVS